jgi:myo-inositol 2-dehydrogenase/D-chiro-inositol 1-dehydrogenase
VAPSNRTTLALIGCGGRGTDVVKNFLQDERVQVIAVCDVERESDRYNKGIIKKAGTLGREPARRLVDTTYGTKGCATHEDFREVLARSDVDAVQIATPDHWHALQAVAAARAKKHIYCEKPLSLTIAQGRFMSDVVRQSGVVWQTGSQQRSDMSLPHGLRIRPQWQDRQAEANPRRLGERQPRQQRLRLSNRDNAGALRG